MHITDKREEECGSQQMSSLFPFYGNVGGWFTDVGELLKEKFPVPYAFSEEFMVKREVPCSVCIQSG